MVKLSAFADEVNGSFIEQAKFLSKEKVNFIKIRFVDDKNILDISKEIINCYRLKPVELRQNIKDFKLGASSG